MIEQRFAFYGPGPGYQWGSFKGDPRRLVEQYFDAFVYLANWGPAS